MNSYDLNRRLAAEALGTLLLVSTVVGSGIMGERLAGGNDAIALLGNTIATGAILVVLILIFGPVSGAHFNPAVSIAFWRDGQLEDRLLPTYVIAQFTGGIAGALIVSGAAPTSLAPSLTLVEGFGIEVAITAALMASILLIVQRSSSRVMIALWVGGTVALLAFIAGPLTGASMNPARTLGPNLLNGMWATLPFYVASTTLGAWLACDIKHRFFPDGSSAD